MPRHHARSVGMLLAACCALTFAPHAHAEGTPDEQVSAAQSFAEGQRAFAAGDYRHAAESFEAAYRDKPHYSPLWNAARSWERAGEAPRAANLYARYLREAPPDAPDRDAATSALTALATKLARLELHPSEGVAVEVDGVPAKGTTLYVNPGDHAIEGKKGALTSRKMQTLRSGEVVSIAVDVGGPRPEEPTPPPTPAHAEPPREARAGHGLPPFVAIAGGVLTLAGAGFTVWSGLDTLSQKDTFDQARTQENLDDGRAKQTRTNVGLVVTSVLGVATGVTAIFFTDWGGHERERGGAQHATTPRVGIGPGSLLVQGAF